MVYIILWVDFEDMDGGDDSIMVLNIVDTKKEAEQFVKTGIEEGEFSGDNICIKEFRRKK